MPAMPRTNDAPKQGDKCPFCKGGILTISPSGQFVMCYKCGRIIVAPKGRQRHE